MPDPERVALVAPRTAGEHLGRCVSHPCCVE